MSKKLDEIETKRIVSKFNPSELRKCIESDLHVDEVMKKLNLSSKQTLRKHLLRLMNEDKKYYDIRGLAERNVNPTVHKNGILRLNLEGFSINDQEILPGDSFEMSFEENRIILTKI